MWNRARQKNHCLIYMEKLQNNAQFETKFISQRNLQYFQYFQYF